MRINHNVAALNTYSRLSQATSAQAKSLEKLSSGLRINKAGDDAAGLAISEKMRGQIRGLDQASRNAQDGISLIQTAEGALNETHSILQRMRELAVQSSNDTNTNVDRTELQKEVNQLISEIDRIGNTTNFNTKNLLDGSAGVAVTASNLAVTNLSGDASTQAGAVSLTAALTTLAVAASYVDASTSALSAGTIIDSASAITVNGTSFSFASTATVQNVIDGLNAKSAATGVTAAFANGTGITFTSVNADSAHQITHSAADLGAFAASTATTVNGADAVLNTTQLGGSYSASGNKVTVVSGNYKGLSFTLAQDADTTMTIGTNNALKMQIGADAGQNMSIGINDMRATALSVSATDVSTQANADNAITTINNAIATVSSERSKLGAYQNRLDHTINNLGTSSENLTASESRVRDVDMAKEMMEYTKNNILNQAATAMLAQANQQPQGVLQLLR